MFLSAVFLALAALATGLPMHDGGSAKVGFPMYDVRIVGGRDTTIEKYPHQVSLEKYEKHSCGGSLISEKFVVTAARCVYGASAEAFRIRAGATKSENDGIVVKLDKMAYNPNFSPLQLDGDVGVLKLQTPLTLSDKIKPISLVPINKEPAANEILTVTGWGDTDGELNGTVLQMVNVPAVDKDVCREAYGKAEITETMICAGESGKDFDMADAGSPLINSKRELVGIASWGTGRGLLGYPGVYGSVASPFIHNFITDFVKNNQ